MAHTPPQLVKPELHVTPQVVPLQVAVPLAGCGHGVHDVSPQVATLVLSTQAVPHKCDPPAHGKLQAPLVQTGVAFAGTGAQSEFTQQFAFGMQALPHSLKPDAHG